MYIACFEVLTCTPYINLELYANVPTNHTRTPLVPPFIASKVITVQVARYSET